MCIVWKKKVELKCNQLSLNTNWDKSVLQIQHGSETTMKVNKTPTILHWKHLKMETGEVENIAC